MGWQTLSAAQKQEAVIALCHQDLNNARIAERLGAPSRHAVANVIRRAKANGHQMPAAAQKPVRKGNWDQAAIHKAAQLWQKGWTTSRIGVELGVSRNAVVGIAGRNRDLFPARSSSAGTRAAKSTPHPPEADIRPSVRKQRKEPAKRRTRRKTTVARTNQPTTIPPAIKPDSKVLVRTKDPAPRVDRQHAFEPIPGCEPVPLINLLPTQCRWPVNGFEGVKPIFCGQHCERTEPYCADHQRIACRRTGTPQTTVFSSNHRPDRLPPGRAGSAGRR